jgi:hypothetical protein
MDDMAPTAVNKLRAGLAGGLLGGVTIWLYEAAVWVGWQQLLPLKGIPANAVGLVFGPLAQQSLGIWAYVAGTAIHFSFAMAWGVLFAFVWPWFRRRGVEATLVALGYALLAWLVMHGAIAWVSDHHPDYTDPVVVIGGIMSHLFYAVPLALYVSHRQRASSMIATPHGGNDSVLPAATGEPVRRSVPLRNG